LRPEHSLVEHVGVGRVGKRGKIEDLGPGQTAACVRRSDQVVGVTEGQNRSDIALGHDEIHQRSRFRLAHHVGAGVPLVIGIGVLEVAVEIHTAGAVLVQESIAVRIPTFPIQRVGTGLSLACIRPLHEPGVVGMNDVVAGWVGYSHDRNEPIAVQILGRILVDAPVVVVVVGSSIAATSVMYSGEHRFGAVRIEAGHDVHHLLIEVCLAAVLIDEVADGLESQRTAHEVITLQVADDQQARPRVHGGS
jgi:hypothetical protein